MDSMIAKIDRINAMIEAMMSVYIIICVSVYEFCSKVSHLGSQITSILIKSSRHIKSLVSLIMLILDGEVLFKAEELLDM